MEQNVWKYIEKKFRTYVDLGAELLGEHGAHTDATLVRGSGEVGLSLLSAGSTHSYRHQEYMRNVFRRRNCRVNSRK